MINDIGRERAGGRGKSEFTFEERRKSVRQPGIGVERVIKVDYDRPVGKPTKLRAVSGCWDGHVWMIRWPILGHQVIEFPYTSKDEGWDHLLNPFGAFDISGEAISDCEFPIGLRRMRIDAIECRAKGFLGF